MSRRKPNTNPSRDLERNPTRVSIGCTGRGAHEFKRITAVHTDANRASPNAMNNAAGANHRRHLGDDDVTHTYRCLTCGRVVPLRLQTLAWLVWTLARNGLTALDISYASDMLSGKASNESSR